MAREAALCATHLQGPRYRDLYQKLKPDKGHGRAVVAIGRHLAEAASVHQRVSARHV